MTGDTQSNGTRYMEAFNDIEQHLRDRYQADQGTPISRLIRSAPDGDMTSAQKDQMLTFAGLRNAIVHNRYYGGRPIADPVDDVVIAIEQLRDHLLRPPTVLGALCPQPPYTARSDQSLPEVLTHLVENNFSQVPVYDGSGYIGLLTTNAIARWVAAHLEDDGTALIESGTVEEALNYAEKDEKALHVARNIPVAEAIHHLTTTETSRTIALIITHSGKPDESPLGIVTASDLPDLYTAIQ